MGAVKAPGPCLYSVGHSTRSIDDFLALLREHGIARVIDVRRYPVSRRHPQFARGRLEMALRENGIEYRHEIDLGGHREPLTESQNGGLRDAVFRGYADHMATPEFEGAMKRLLRDAARARTALMCAEANVTDCHRRLIADALVARGARVVHVLSAQSNTEHVIDRAARVQPDGRVIYPPAEPRRGSQLHLDMGE